MLSRELRAYRVYPVRYLPFQGDGDLMIQGLARFVVGRRADLLVVAGSSLAARLLVFGSMVLFRDLIDSDPVH